MKRFECSLEIDVFTSHKLNLDIWGFLKFGPSRKPRLLIIFSPFRDSFFIFDQFSFDLYGDDRAQISVQASIVGMGRVDGASSVRLFLEHLHERAQMDEQSLQESERRATGETVLIFEIPYPIIQFHIHLHLL